MDIFRKFSIRKAEVISAKVLYVSANLHARQTSISIRAEDDSRAELRMILEYSELADLHHRLGDALDALHDNSKNRGCPQPTPASPAGANSMNLTHKDALALRQWIRDVNAQGARFGHEDLAGTPDDPDPDYVERWQAGQTPAQVVAADFGDQAPSC